MSFHDEFLESFQTTPSKIRGEIDYIERLAHLRTTIAPQLNHIAVTFPEYTPHDWDFHIVPLFQIAARIYGGQEILALPPMTRFLIGVGLYAHDWGMAVLEDEREAIHSLISSPAAIAGDHLMPNERERLEYFAGQFGVQQNEIADALTDDSSNFWAEYVRNTHALRSGERIKKILLNPEGDRALADAGCAVCVGHALDFKELHSNPSFDARTIGNQKVYPRLAALVVRIVDLFDIGRDRTPFMLRQKIGPSDTVSVMEWDKHAALDQVSTAPLTANTFRIKVTGQCDDPDVWAALNDLRDYCRDQLTSSVRSISDELAEIRRDASGSESFELRVPDSALEWDVQTNGFEPIDLKFRFSQRGVFEILSSEIYQSDPHIFVRELLQNAIDAVRRQNFQSEGKISKIPIELTSKTETNGNKVISCRDFGIGMNIRVITDYLAVIGESYYRSSEFEKKFPKLPSVSRFGIGILSCFTVADSIKVVTRAQNKHGEGDKAFEVELKDIDRNCVVREFTEHFEPGTKIELTIVPAKLQKFVDATNTQRKISISTFLKANATFVEFPISVVEDGVKELLLPPGYEKPQSVEKSDLVVQLNGEYRWADELDQIKLHPRIRDLSSVIVDVENDLGYSGIEGFVSFPVPCLPEQDFGFQEGSIFGRESALTIRINGLPAKRSSESVELSPFVAARDEEGTATSWLLYQDGILVESGKPIGDRRNDFPFCEHIWINYKGDSKNSLTASRSRFSKRSGPTARKIADKAKLFVLKKEFQRTVVNPLHTRARRLGWLTQVLGLSIGEIARNFPRSVFPLLILGNDGKLKLTCERALSDTGEIALITPAAANHVTRAWALSALSAEDASAMNFNYAGVPCIYMFGDSSESWKIDDATKSVYDNFCRIAYVPVGLRFVTPFESESPILPMKTLKRREIAAPVNTGHFLRRIWEDKVPLKPDDWALLRVHAPMGTSFLFPRLFEFPESHKNFFAYGTDYFNLSHPATKFLLRCYSLVSDNGGYLDTGPISHKGIHDWIQRTLGNGRGQEYSYEVFEIYWNGAPHSLKVLCEKEGIEVPQIPLLDEFVSKSINGTRMEALQESAIQTTGGYDPAKWIEGWGVDV